MKTTWLITSAISTEAGIYDPPARIRQTNATIDSILQHYPDATLVLIEGGRAFDSADFSRLVQRCHIFADTRNNEYVREQQYGILGNPQLRQQMTGDVGIAKSLNELFILNFALRKLKTDAPLVLAERIFKISGRYQLSPLFDPSVYLGIGDKYVFRRREPSWIENAMQRINTDHMFCSRLWSFGLGQLDDTLSTIERMIPELVEAGRKQVFIDIEHLLFKHLGARPDIHELDHVHVMGSVAPSGVLVYD